MWGTLIIFVTNDITSIDYCLFNLNLDNFEIHVSKLNVFWKKKNNIFEVLKMFMKTMFMKFWKNFTKGNYVLVLEKIVKRNIFLEFLELSRKRKYFGPFRLSMNKYGWSFIFFSI